LDAEGKKMSKSLGNIVDPWLMMDKYGVDSLRLWMFSVNQPGDSKNFDEKTVDEIVKKVINPIENIISFYFLYKDELIK
jgi:isoleucyl-tRNA synthetase